MTDRELLRDAITRDTPTNASKRASFAPNHRQIIARKREINARAIPRHSQSARVLDARVPTLRASIDQSIDQLASPGGSVGP